ncbi:glycosyltransferase family A protein [Chryseobacterium sp. MP_3.2]|uniref:glycosyltransferase family A protein n=1 Tax=Chryseobacterium sp. MP_3.2 TaxID=3071712 RepID=UPI002E0699C7|nr:glycosyltransferase involved in cell wall biosynthesis [Chryseobacterium sp. MP_3.2]
MKNLTVFTPTFNRKHLLPRLYESLIKQTDTNFIWMVIDDGSSDGTEALIKTYNAENIIEIKYYWKKNQGMHSAHNWAYEKIETLWNTCIDSDDMMAPNAVENICKNLQSVEIDHDFYAIVGLDADQEGNIIGTKFPPNVEKIKFNQIYLKYHLTGDKKIVCRTEVMKKLPPYPIYEGERLVPLDYKSLLADQFAFIKPVNEVWCIVEYQEDGSTRNMLKQYRRNPRGFAFSRISRINFGATFKEKFKNAIHLVSSSFFSKDFASLLKTRHSFLVLLAIPAGILLHIYIRSKTVKNC